MKKIVLILLFIAFSINIDAQLINTIPVPGSTNPTLSQALNEFNYYYTNKCRLTWTASSISSYFSYPTISWPLPMLAWAKDYSDPYSDPAWPKWTAEAVIAYAGAFRIETDATRRANYETKAKGGAEFLLWLISASGNDGGLPDYLTSYSVPTTNKGIFTTGMAGSAFYECFLSFGDQKYRDALISTANWQMNNPGYPYQFPADNFKYYSNVNHLSRQLKHLCEAYKVTGNQTFLDRAIQIAEETIAWQNYIDSRNPWPSGSIPDGSWYWYDYSATAPLPPGVVTPPGGGFAAERKIDYHTLTVDGLISLLESTSQQLLPGTTTIRNSASFTTFRTNLRNAIINSINYMINNQETTNDNSVQRYSGMFKSYKNYTAYGGDAVADPPLRYNSAPHGLSTIMYGYLALLRTNVLSSQDRSRLESLINAVSSTYLGKYNFNWTEDVQRVVSMSNWASYMYYKNLPSITPTLSLVNPSFEDRNTVWELWSWNGSGVTISNSYARTGSNSVRLLDNDPNASMFAEQMTTASPGTTYKAEAYARIITSRQSLYLLFYDQNYNLLDFNHTEVWANSSWQQITVQMTAPTSTAYAVVKAHADWYWTSDGYWDDFSLSTVLPKQSVENQIPISYSLQNYPNPFNPTTKISFALPSSGFVTLKVYDVLGREVAILANRVFASGKYELDFNASNLPSGTYIYSLRTDNKTITKKMLLVK